MNLLAIETSTDACSVALLADGETLLDHRMEPRRHAQLVLPMIDALLAEAALSRGALDGVAFGRGPGSFTGVRVAASIAQGIALGLDIGVIGVSTLACIAEGCRRELGDLRVGVALDARLDEIYWGAFVASPGGIMSAVIEERVCAPEAATLSVGRHEGRRGGEDAGEGGTGRGEAGETAKGETDEAADREALGGASGEASGRADFEASRAPVDASRWRLAGPGAERYARTLLATLIPDGERSRTASAETDEGPALRFGRLPNARDTLTLASATVASDGFGPPESALPVYLRERVARTEAERGIVRHGSRG